MPAQFMCVAIGIPTPSISWLKNGVPLQQNTNAIQLASTQLSDQAVYSCVASNNAGTAQASANLTIIGMMGSKAHICAVLGCPVERGYDGIQSTHMRSIGVPGGTWV